MILVYLYKLIYIFTFLFQSDITDVNQIFKDLAMLVHEQGDVIGK